MCRIGCIIVTYNRLEKLKKALDAYYNQTEPPLYIVIVNNCSTDNTKKFLENWKKQPSAFARIVVHLSRNIGGSGGFYEGLKYAMKMEASWIFLSDDDAYPEPDCFLKFKQYIHEYKKSGQNLPSALCGKVVTSGQIDRWHRRILRRFCGILYEEKVKEEKYQNIFEITFLSYVGSLIRVEALKQAGLTEKDFFIAYDDSEHSYRLSQTGKIICLPNITIEHDTGRTEYSPASWKRYYSIRNKVYSYRKHFGTRQATALSLYYFAKSCWVPSLRKMTCIAISDAFKGKLGLSEKYRP